MKQYVIKSLAISKGDIAYEIHKFGCSDNYKDDPIQVFGIEAENAEQVIGKDMKGGGIELCEYKIMPCVK